MTDNKNIYSRALKDDSVKFEIIRLSNEGFSGAEIGRDLGIPERSVRHFLSKSSFPEFWEKYEELCEIAQVESDVEDKILMEKNDYLDLAMKLKANVQETREGVRFLEVPPQYLHKDASKEDKEIYEVYKSCMRKLKEGQQGPLKILIIADTQAKSTEDLSYLSWIGKYINDKRPDVVVHIGDHYDFPSLSSYDKGKKSFEGRRLKSDIEAGNRGMELLTREFLFDDYSPRMIFCMGNHEHRFDRLAHDMPELDGFVGTDTLPLVEMGWEVYPFLKPVEIGGIFFVHYLANPMTGKPYGGSALNQLKTVGKSFVVGHKQCLDVAIRNTLDGKQQIGIINGACYPFEEDYKGFQGNAHFRGLTMLHEVEDGSAVPMFVSLDYLKSRYQESKL